MQYNEAKRISADFIAMHVLGMRSSLALREGVLLNPTLVLCDFNETLDYSRSAPVLNRMLCDWYEAGIPFVVYSGGGDGETRSGLTDLIRAHDPNFRVALKQRLRPGEKGYCWGLMIDDNPSMRELPITALDPGSDETAELTLAWAMLTPVDKAEILQGWVALVERFNTPAVAPVEQLVPVR